MKPRYLCQGIATATALFALASGASWAQAPQSDDWSSGKLQSFWTFEAIGDNQGAEANSVSGGALHLTAGGADVWAAPDNFVYAFQKASGNFRITTEVNAGSLDPPDDPNAKAGLMIRASDDPAAAYDYLFESPYRQGVLNEMRQDNGGTNQSAVGNTQQLPAWLQFTRVNGVLIAAWSSDGSRFYSLGPIADANQPSTVTAPVIGIPGLLPDPLLVGIAQSALNTKQPSHASYGAFNVATFSNQSAPPAAVTDLAASNVTSNSVDLSFTEPAAGDGKSPVAYFDVRYSTSPITAGNFSKATPASGAPIPAGPGTKQTFTVSGLGALLSYYFAVEAVDGSSPKSNVGAISNVATVTIPPATQGVLREVWLNVSGSAVTDLENDPSYPNSPDLVEVDPTFEAPSNWADNYGQRLSAILTPDKTADYTFWIASDDNSSLRLSTDADSKNATEIAMVSNWTNPRDWTQETDQKSAPVHLVAGQQYYIEAVHKDIGGEDNLAVTWDHDAPGIPGRTPIDGKYLAPPPGISFGRLQGVVKNELGVPLPGVVLTDSLGESATTRADGSYSFLAPAGAGDVTLTQPPFSAITATVKGGATVTKNQLTTQDFTLTGGLVPIGKVSLRSTDLTAAGNPGWSFMVFPDASIFGAAATPDPDALKTYQDPNLAITGDDSNSGGTWITGWGPVPGDREPTDHTAPGPNDIPDNSYWAQAVKVAVPSSLASATQYSIQDFNVDDYMTMFAVNGNIVGQDLTGNYAKDWQLAVPPSDLKLDGSNNLLLMIGYQGGGGAGMTTDSGGPNLVAWGPGSASSGPLLGDLNGDGKVNVQDATISLRIAVGLTTPTDDQKAAGDVNHDGKWNVQDTTLILRAAVGLGTLS